jgi:hypothetical protein
MKRCLACYAWFATLIQRFPECLFYEKRYTDLDLRKKIETAGFRVT